MDPKELMKIFGTINPEEIEKILKGKEGNKQQKVVNAKKPKLVNISADECKKLCKQVGLKYLDGYEGRVIEHVISEESTDRDGDILRAKGADFTNYSKNATILFVHNSRDFPVGKSIKHWVQGKKVMSWGLFLDDRVDPEGIADKVFRYVSNGAMPAVSVGFIPLKGGINRPASKEEREKLGLGDWGVEFTKWEVLEYSVCPVPCNPNALQNMLKVAKENKGDYQFLINSKMLPEDLLKGAIDDGFNWLTSEIEKVVTDDTEEPTMSEAIKIMNDSMDKAIERINTISNLFTLKIDSLNKSLEPLFKDFSSPVKPVSIEKDNKETDLYNLIRPTNIN